MMMLVKWPCILGAAFIFSTMFFMISHLLSSLQIRHFGILIAFLVLVLMQIYTIFLHELGHMRMAIYFGLPCENIYFGKPNIGRSISYRILGKKVVIQQWPLPPNIQIEKFDYLQIEDKKRILKAGVFTCLPFVFFFALIVNPGSVSYFQSLTKIHFHTEIMDLVWLGTLMILVIQIFNLCPFGTSSDGALLRAVKNGEKLDDRE